jgi:hypothetical protein
MIVFSEGRGGTMNADLQCSRVHTLSRVGIGNVVTVHNSCKDAIPLQFWVCICLPAAGTLHGIRFAHLDARHFGYGTRVRGELSYPARLSSKRIRVFMAEILKEGGFECTAALWAYAERKDLPRVERPL